MIKNPDNALCVITPTYNDFEAFVGTLESFRHELRISDQLIVIDSSNNPRKIPEIVSSSGLLCAVHIVWQPPSGVYAALNAGISAADRPWLQIVNSGDGLLPGAREALNQVISANSSVVMHVFYQKAGGVFESGYIFKPDARSLWPHQSVVLHRTVHEQLGYYDNRLHFTADQMFLAEARKIFPWMLHEFVLTRYDLNGLSAARSIRISRELWGVWRALGRGFLEACWRAWIKPSLRAIIQLIFGHRTMISIKISLTRIYLKDNK
jgi:hypothetical protein